MRQVCQVIRTRTPSGVSEDICGDTIRFYFKSAVLLTNSNTGAGSITASLLLKEACVSKSMGNQSPSLVRSWRELTRTEHNVATYRIGIGVNIPCRLLSGSARMHPHARKVGAEARLKKGANRLRQRLASAPQCINISLYIRGDFWCLATRSLLPVVSHLFYPSPIICAST